ncbi:MAG: alanyl-tRNA editing protein [Ktedonobacteraceae bacterium]
METVTSRLYFDDSYLRQFNATVIASRSYRQLPAVILDQTAFYPEGGGQPADRGNLNGIPIVDVQEVNGEILHILEAEIPPGAVVSGEIDWQRRFDHMQQHTGQHTLSATFQRLFNAETLSWHLVSEYVTIELGHAAFSPGEIAQAELAANRIVWENRPVTARIYPPEELASLELRKSTTRSSDIRIVTIQDWDAIGCGGTHVKSTAEVGQIAIRRHEARGNTVRIEFLCGLRAVADYRRMADTVNGIASLLSVKPDQVSGSVQRLKDVQQSLEEDLAQAHKKLLQYEAQNLLARAARTYDGCKVVCEIVSERDANQLRFIAQQLATSGAIALLGSLTVDKAYLCFTCPKSCSISMNTLLQQALPYIGGRGGGQQTLAQGGGTQLNGLQAALDAARASISVPSV